MALTLQLAQLALPIIPPGKLVHSPAHVGLPHVWKRNQAREKARGKHSPSADTTLNRTITNETQAVELGQSVSALVSI